MMVTLIQSFNKSPAKVHGVHAEDRLGTSQLPRQHYSTGRCLVLFVFVEGSEQILTASCIRAFAGLGLSLGLRAVVLYGSVLEGGLGLRY